MYMYMCMTLSTGNKCVYVYVYDFFHKMLPPLNPAERKTQISDSRYLGTAVPFKLKNWKFDPV